MPPVKSSNTNITADEMFRRITPFETICFERDSTRQQSLESAVAFYGARRMLGLLVIQLRQARSTALIEALEPTLDSYFGGSSWRPSSFSELKQAFEAFKGKDSFEAYFAIKGLMKICDELDEKARPDLSGFSNEAFSALHKEVATWLTEMPAPTVTSELESGSISQASIEASVARSQEKLARLRAASVSNGYAP